MADSRVFDELRECACACVLLSLHCVQDIQWLREAANTFSHNRLLSVVEKLKGELTFLRNHANFPAAGV